MKKALYHPVFPHEVTLYPFYRRLGAPRTSLLLLIDCYIFFEKLNKMNFTMRAK